MFVTARDYAFISQELIYGILESRFVERIAARAKLRELLRTNTEFAAPLHVGSFWKKWDLLRN